MGDIFQQDEQFRQLIQDVFLYKMETARTDKDRERFTRDRDSALAEYTAETAPILVEFSDLNNKYIRRNTGMSGIDAFYATSIESFAGIITEEAYEARKKELVSKFYTAQNFVSETFKFVCTRCNVAPLLEEGLYICPECNGIVAESLVYIRKNSDTSMSSWGKTRYKRSARLQEVISKYAETSSSCMTYHQVVLRVIELLGQERRKVTEKSIREILAQENIEDGQFEHRIIVDIIMKNKRSFISDSDIAGVMYIFEETNDVYQQACRDVSSDRVNFFSYDFFIGCALKHLDKARYHDYEHLISRLRERDNLFAQMTIWKRVCEIRGWPV